jgi:hypothetical protein
MTTCTSQDMNLVLISKKKALMKYMKEKELVADKDFKVKLSALFRYAYDTGFKFGSEKMLNYFENNLNLIQEQVNWFKQAKIYDGFIYFVHDNDNSKNAKIHFTVFNTGEFKEEKACEIQAFEGNNAAGYGFYDFKLVQDNQFYTWYCDKNCRD